MKLKTLEELYVNELKDLYSAERQLVKALPKMEEAAESEELKAAFSHHLEETTEHVNRLESIYAAMDRSPGRKKCMGMEGLIIEAEERIEGGGEPSVLDAGLIAAAQRVEHYEIAAYCCVRTYAELLRQEEAGETLQSTLDEEVIADTSLSALAESVINVEAAEAA